MKPGPKKGYKQSPEHIAKRKRWGKDHHAWKGDDVTVKAGRSRALRRVASGECEKCGADKAERHHIDGDTLNNTSENISLLCRRCHMETDGRLAAFTALAKENQPHAVAARWR